jgi:serine/threonine protein kinase/tetratricopeptide (TPR) repeat protein
MIGKKLGHYRIAEKLGAGGMGEVYLAHDEHLPRDVAIKVLPPRTLADEPARRRFRKEALALCRLNHPNIETIHDFDTEDGIDFLVMEYLPGQTLSEKLAAGPLPEKKIAKLGTQLAEGLAAAHQQGVVHCDLKPSNMLVTPDDRLKILDFGLARLVRPVSSLASTASLTETQEVAGTLPYMAPEQLQGERVDARTDIYAAGVVVYEMATGHRPFREQLVSRLTDAILHQLPERPSVLNRQVSPGLEALILKALEKEPERRYQSARDLQADFLRLGAPSGAVMPVRPRRRYRRWLMATGAVVAVALLALLAMKIGRWRDQSLGRGKAFDSIAVLPLENLSGDSNQQYFSDGMTEALITELSRIRAIKVISRTSVMGYKGTRKKIPEIARELGVSAIVEGSTVRSGKLVRINVQLIDGRSDEHLWADNFDREYRDILSMQSEAALAIAKQIQATLTPQEARALARKRSVNPDAYEAYLKGMFVTSTMSNNLDTKPGLEKSIQFFEQALTIDPNFALAYAGIAVAFDNYASANFAPPKETFPKAIEAARKALNLDDSLADPHLVLADIKCGFEWDFDNAEREYRRFFELNPNYAMAHAWYALCLASRGRGREGEALLHADRARELDPVTYSTGEIVTSAYFVSRHYDRALALAKELINLHPNNPAAHREFSWVCLPKGLYKESLVEYQKSIELGAPPDPVWLAGIYAFSGEKPKARELLNGFLSESKQKYVNSWNVAGVYSLLGEKDKAFEWLEKGYDERSTFIPATKVHPTFDNLHSDPRFTALMRKIGLEK